MQQQYRGTIPTLRTARPERISLLKRRTWFADEDGADGTGDTPPPTDTQPAKTGQEGGGDSAATFTQADIDRIAGERAKRAEEATLKKLLADLEVTDTDSLKAMLKAQKEREEAEKTELEKAQAKVDAAEKKAADAEARAQSVEQARLEDRRDSAIQAALNGATKPGAVLTLIKSEFSDDLAKVMSEDGALNEKLVKALADKAEKEWPGMFKSGGPGSQSHSGGLTPRSDNKELVEQIKRGLRY